MAETQPLAAVAEPAAWEERSVDADGFHIRYLEAGPGPPRLDIRMPDRHERYGSTLTGDSL